MSGFLIVPDKFLSVRSVVHCNRWCSIFLITPIWEQTNSYTPDWWCTAIGALNFAVENVSRRTHIMNLLVCLFSSARPFQNYGHLGTVHTQNNHVQKLDLEWVKKSCPTKTNKTPPNKQFHPTPTSECHLSRTNKWKHNKFRIKFRCQLPSVFMEQSSFKFCSQSLFYLTLKKGEKRVHFCM